MTCYFQHMKDVFEKAGVKVTKENKRDIDRIIHDLLGIEYKQCSATWREVKKRLADDQEAFITTLRKAVSYS